MTFDTDLQLQDLLILFAQIESINNVELYLEQITPELDINPEQLN